MNKGRLTCLLWILFSIPIVGISQPQGIQFENNLNWKEIQQKAKSEHKFIFLDCFTTWCGPCKQMEKSVYPNDSVGDLVKGKIIAVKVQMDTSKTDDEREINWYADAHMIEERYSVNAFPTFLFFSPDGNIVHKGVGFRNVADFIDLIKDALIPSTQYYTLLKNYDGGHKTYSTLVYLANTSAALGDMKTAVKIARDYIDYIWVSNDTSFYTKEDIEFVKHFTMNSYDKGFKMFYLDTRKVNTVMNDPNYSQRVIDYIISTEEVDPAILLATKTKLVSPNWTSLRRKILDKYRGEYANRVITIAQARWYGWRKELPKYTRTSSFILKKYGNTMDDFEINQYAWGIFLYSINKHELKTALLWAKRTLSELPVNMNQADAETDTYANLLYKLGHKEDAIRWEHKAIELAIKEGLGERQDFLGTLKKMEKGIPTW